MKYTIYSRLMIVAFLSGFSISAFADEAAQIRQDCEDEVAGYGIENIEEQQQAIEDCIAYRTGTDLERAETTPVENN